MGPLGCSSVLTAWSISSVGQEICAPHLHSTQHRRMLSLKSSHRVCTCPGVWNSNVEKLAIEALPCTKTSHNPQFATKRLLPLLQEAECIKKFGVVTTTSRMSSGNSPWHLPFPLTVCINHPLSGCALVAHPQRQKDSCHSSLVRTQTTDVTCGCSNNMQPKCPSTDLLLSTHRQKITLKKSQTTRRFTASPSGLVSPPLPLPLLLPKTTFLDF